jgi:uncharacterized membrane protein
MVLLVATSRSNRWNTKVAGRGVAGGHAMKSISLVQALVVASCAAMALAQVEYVAVPGVVLKSVSADGNTAIGYRCGPNSCVPIGWQRGVGVADLPVPNGTNSVHTFVMGISWDGSRMAATIGFSNQHSVVQWRSGLPTMIGDLPGGHPSAAESTICPSGEFVIGGGRDDSGISALRWSEQTGLVSMGRFNGFATQALAGSYDASVMVGMVVAGAGYQAWRYSPGIGYRQLHAPGNAMPVACSADGQVAVGFHGIGGGNVDGFACRWDGAGIFSSIQSLPSRASGISADGRIIVGWRVPEGSDIPEAFIWDANHGARSLQSVAHLQGGTSVPALGRAYGVSADGRTIVGEGFVLRLAAPCAADVDDGSGSGGRDDTVTPDDLLAFILWLTEGDMRADLDNGTGTGIPDAAVTIEDLLYFLGGYEGGC